MNFGMGCEVKGCNQNPRVKVKGWNHGMLSDVRGMFKSLEIVRFEVKYYNNLEEYHI